MDIITTETSYTNQHNQPVLKTRSTVIVRELPSERAKEPGA
jgi:hypothetical protein